MTTPTGGGGGRGYNGGGGQWFPPVTPVHHPPSTPLQHHQQYQQPYHQQSYPIPYPQSAGGNLWGGGGVSPGPVHYAGGHPQHTPGHYYPPAPPQTPSKPAPPEMSTVLISLGDTYLDAAHSYGCRAALADDADADADAEAYYKLVATGLGCLEAALQYRLQPRVEAMARLKYASILFDETDNLDEAEDALNKGILLTGRNNLADIKYSMQHLLVRIMFKTSPKAAIKMLATNSTESETLDIPLWTYSFRILRFNLLIEQSPIRDDQAAIHTLQKIENFAQQRRDIAMAAFASLLEAMVYLRPGVDGIESAQRALARTFSLQNSGVPMPSQLEVLTHFLDVVCSLMAGRSTESEMKIKTLHVMLDQADRWTTWREDGAFEIPINSSRPGRPPEMLKLRWLSKDDIFALGYFLSGLCKFQKNVEESGKGERFLAEGVKTTDRITDSMRSIPGSLETAKGKLTWRRRLKCYMLTYQCFLLSVRTDWDTALKSFGTLEELSQSLDVNGTPLGNLIIYLKAVICHGTNDLYNALTLYSSLFNILSVDSELSLICKLNAILILRVHDYQQAEYLMSTIEKFCPQHKNENIKAAYIAVKATEKGELVKTKNYLSLALRHATVAMNQQLTFIVLSFMCQRFFTGVISEQAEKSAKAAMQNAKKGRDNLWTLMGGELYADCLGRKGNEMDAARQRQMNNDVRQIVMRNLLRNQPPQQQAPEGEYYTDGA